MEQKRMANIDIEKCKELFEYEMTEVLLMLKGEFASVSGKDLGYSQYHVSEEKRNAPLAAIKKEQITEVSFQPMNLPDIVVNSPELSLQKVELPVIPPINQKQQVEIHCPVSVPTVSLRKIQQIPAWNGELPKIQLPEMKGIPMVSIPDIVATYQKADIPATTVAVGAIPEVTYERIHVQLPDMSHCPIPEITVEKMKNADEKSDIFRKSWENISVPQIPAIEIHPVSVSKYLVGVPNMEKCLQEKRTE